MSQSGKSNEQGKSVIEQVQIRMLCGVQDVLWTYFPNSLSYYMLINQCDDEELHFKIPEAERG